MDLHEVFMASKIAGRNKGNSGNVDLSDYYTKAQTDSLLSDKVSKTDGMGLSENSFTNAEKAKLSGLENYNDTEIKSETALNLNTLGYQRKNLLKNTAVSRTASGVTFTVNGDGSVTLNGTATADILNYFVVSDFRLMYDEMILSGCPAGGSMSGYKLDVTDSGRGVIANDMGQGVKIKKSDTSGVVSVRIRVGSGTVFDNLTFCPMLRNSEITDGTYEPYKPSVLEYIEELEERLKVLEENIT